MDDYNRGGHSKYGRRKTTRLKACGFTSHNT